MDQVVEEIGESVDEPVVEEMIKSYKDAINHVGRDILGEIDNRLVQMEEGMKPGDIFAHSSDVSFVARLLEPADPFEAELTNGNTVTCKADPYEVINIPTMIEQHTFATLETKLRTALVGTPYETIEQGDIDDILKKGVGRAASVFKRACTFFGNKLAEEVEASHNLIVKYGIESGDFRIFGYFEKNSAGALGEPVYSNDEAFAKFHQKTSIKKIQTAVKVTDELDEVSNAMRNSKAFTISMGSAHQTLSESCRKLDITTQNFKVFSSTNGLPILMKSSTVATDEDYDEISEL